jgi:DNA-binding transcriptional ArsR family regulator
MDLKGSLINHMVERDSAALDRVFRALASGPRREILRRTAQRPRTVTELAEHFDLTLAAVSKHVGVLDAANLLVRTRDGRLLWRRLNPEALEPARSALDELRVFWARQLDGLERYLSLDAPGARRRARRSRSKR